MADATDTKDDLDPNKLESLLESESESIADDEENSAFEAAIGAEAGSDYARSHKKAAREDEASPDDDPGSTADDDPESKKVDDKDKNKDDPDAKPKGDAEPDDDNGKKPHDPMAAYMQKIESRIRNMEGKFGTLNAQLQAQKTTREQGGKVPTRQQINEAQGDSEKLTELKKEFPEWADVVVEEREENSKRFVSKEELEKTTQDIYTRVREEVRRELHEEKQIETIDKAHPGWLTTINSTEFHDWLKAQDENTRALVASSRADDAIALLDEFEQHKEGKAPPADDQQKQEQQRQVEQREKQKQKLEASVSPTTGATPTKPRPMTEDEAFAAAAKRTRNG